MKKVLLDSNKNYYKANMHCHSIYSDGKNTVEELKKMYMAEGYSIIAFTDHEHLIDNSHLDDDEFLSITSCEHAIKQFENMSTLVKRDMKVAHLNIYAKDQHNVNTPCYSRVYDHYTDNVKEIMVVPEEDYKRVYSAEGVSEIIDIANKEGFLVAYNHPRWSLEDARDYLGYKGLWALEMLNSSCWETGYYDYNPTTYDEFLRDGNIMGCVMGDDNHNTPHHSFIGYTMINAEKLEYDEIMKALENYNFYCSMGPVINGLYIEDGKAHISVDKGEKVIMTTGIRYVEKQMITDENKHDLVFEVKDEYKYIRFDVIDEFGKRANTNAYFVDGRQS